METFERRLMIARRDAAAMINKGEEGVDHGFKLASADGRAIATVTTKKPRITVTVNCTHPRMVLQMQTPWDADVLATLSEDPEGVRRHVDGWRRLMETPRVKPTWPIEPVEESAKCFERKVSEVWTVLRNLITMENPDYPRMAEIRIDLPCMAFPGRIVDFLNKPILTPRVETALLSRLPSMGVLEERDRRFSIEPYRRTGWINADRFDAVEALRNLADLGMPKGRSVLLAAGRRTP